MTTKAREISLADFVEESLTAVNRVIEIGPNRDRFGRIIFGLIWDGGQTGGGFGLPGFDPADLQFIKTGKPLNTDSANEMTDLLQRDYRRYGITFANSLGQNFGRTMDTLFELSPEQRDTVYELTRESSDSLQSLSRLLVATFSVNTDDFHFDMNITPSNKPTAAKWDWSLEIGSSCDTDKKCKVEAKLVIKF
jgi:hypothetical protein